MGRFRHSSSYFSDSIRGYGHGGYGQHASVVELLVPMCCTKCEEKVNENMLELRGVQGVMVDLQRQRVVVTGFVDPLKALKAARKVKKDSQLWNGSPYNVGVGGEMLAMRHHDAPYLDSSAYRTSRYEYDPYPAYRSNSRYESYDPSPVYRTSRYEYNPSSMYNSYDPYGPPAFRTSYDDYMPLYEQNSYLHRGPMSWPAYTDGYSPRYLQDFGSEYY